MYDENESVSVEVEKVRAKRRTTTRAQDIQLGIAAVGNKDTLEKAQNLRECVAILKTATGIDIADSTARDVLDAAGIAVPTRAEKDKTLKEIQADVGGLFQDMLALRQKIDGIGITEIQIAPLVEKRVADALEQVNLRLSAMSQRIADVQSLVGGYSAMIEDLQAKVRYLENKPDPCL